MRTYKIVSFSVVIFLITVLFAGVVTVPGAAQYDTMQYRYNAAHTGDYSPVAGFVPSNGQLKWSYPTGTLVSSSPAVANGVVYVGSSDGNVYAFNAATGALKWSFTTGDIVLSSPAVANGVVYVGSNDGNVYAFNAATGALKWSCTTGAVETSSPAVANGVVYVGIYDGKVYAIDAATGAKVWNFTTGSNVESSPAVANGVVYVGSSDYNVYAIDAATGAKVWNFTTGSYVDSSPAVANGVVYVGSVDGNVYAFNAATGALKWSFTTGTWVESSPAVANGVVYVGGGYDVYALNAATGAKVWNFTTGSNVESSPAVVNGVVYVGSDDHKVYALNAVTGAKLWSYTTDGWVESSPAVANGVVYVGGWDRVVYAIGNQPVPPHGSTPTTFGLSAASQSVKPNAKVLIKGNLRTGATGLPGQPVELWVKSGTGSWYKAATTKTGTGTNAGVISWSVGSANQVARTNQYYFVFPGSGTYARATSNVVAIKFENIKTTPYQTALYAYAPKQVVPHGTTNTMWVRLLNGATPLSGKYIYVWKWSGGRWVSVSRIITRTGTQAGWALAGYMISNAGTGLYKFTYYGPLPYDQSTSNAVQLRWT